MPISISAAIWTDRLVQLGLCRLSRRKKLRDEIDTLRGNVNWMNARLFVPDGSMRINVC
jgi:hypothetical protein